MFTGIVTQTTAIKQAKPTGSGLLLTLTKPNTWEDLQLGESIATDGVCLTVSAKRKTEYDCQLVPETLQKTTFGKVIPPRVNLERSLRVSDRFGGHFVQGHIDTVVKVISIREDDGWLVQITLPSKDKDLIVSKGSVALNGVSLTVANITSDSFEVALIPHTLKHTTLGLLKVGDAINIEFDMIGKYVVRSLENAKSTED